MDDYISRATAMSMPLANGQYDHEHANEHFILGLETYKEWLEQLPAADVAHVVFCKDCKWLDRWNGCDCHNPRFGDGYANYPPPMVRDDFFCADGKRREGGTP